MDFVPEIGFALAGIAAVAAGVRFWRQKQQSKRYDALLVIERSAYLTLRSQPLAAAERQMAELLHVTGDLNRLPPYIHASILYTHGCLLIEENSLKYAVERFSGALQIARSAYGHNTIYAVPPAVALAFIHFTHGHLEKSGRLLAHCLRCYRGKFGEDDRRTVRVRAMLAMVAFAAGLTQEAISELRESARQLDAVPLGGTADAATVRQAIAKFELLTAKRRIPGASSV